jgi:hypothetical protein
MLSGLTVGIKPAAHPVPVWRKTPLRVSLCRACDARQTQIFKKICIFLRCHADARARFFDRFGPDFGGIFRIEKNRTRVITKPVRLCSVRRKSVQGDRQSAVSRSTDSPAQTPFVVSAFQF